jgi:hypothetical protein
MKTELDINLDKAALDRAKHEVIRVTISPSGLRFVVDVRDIFRWEKELIKHDIWYTMVDTTTEAEIASSSAERQVSVPETYRGIKCH